MKTLISIAIILVASACQAQTITVDPNLIVEGPEYVTVTIQLTISVNEYAAMQYKNWTFADVFRRMRIVWFYERLVEDVTLAIARNKTIAELQAMER